MSPETNETISINKPEEAVDSEENRRVFFAKAPIQAATALQKALPVKESGYRFVVGHAHGDARAYYLYGILDEVLKACVASMRWDELLGDTEKKHEVVAAEDEHLGRVVIESIIDEQLMWARKLTEILSDLILFSSANDQDHYRLYLACKQLDAYLGLQKDFGEFFACRNVNIDTSIDLLCDEIGDIGKRIDVRRVWFLKKPIDRKKLPRPGSIFGSARERFKQAVEVASPDHRLVLGASYETGHSVPSRSIHPNIGGPRREVSLQDVDRNIGRVGLLCIHTVLVAHTLSGINPKGVGEQLLRVLDKGTNAPEILERVFQRELDIGDIVFAYGEDLCQVIDRSKSKYGFTSFKVRYLTKPMIPEVKEDWFPVRYIRRLYPRKEIRQRMVDLLRKRGTPEDQIEEIQNLTDEELSLILAKTFTELERVGALKRMLASGQSGATEKETGKPSPRE